MVWLRSGAVLMLFHPYCNPRLNTKVIVTPQKKLHLGSSELATDGTVHFNGYHENTTYITTYSPLRGCIQHLLLNCVTHIARVVHCVAKRYLASTVANGICHFWRHTAHHVSTKPACHPLPRSNNRLGKCTRQAQGEQAASTP